MSPTIQNRQQFAIVCCNCFAAGLASAPLAQVAPQGFKPLCAGDCNIFAFATRSIGGFFFFWRSALESRHHLSGWCFICPRLTPKISHTVPVTGLNTRATFVAYLPLGVRRVRFSTFRKSILAGASHPWHPFGSFNGCVFYVANHFGGSVMSATILKKQSTYLDEHKQAAADAGLPDDDGNAIVIVTFIFSILLTMASVAQNAMFAMSIAQSFAAGMVLVSIYLGFDLGKIVCPALIRLFWMKGNHFFSFFIGFGFVAATLASLAAGTSFMATSIEGAQQERVKHSPEAKANFEAQQRLQAEISAMAVSPAAVAQATREIQRLEGLWERAYAKNSAYMTRDYTPKERWFKRTARAVAEDMTPIDNAIAAQKQILQAAEDYQGKIAELERLRDLAPTIADGAGELAGFVALGAWAGVPSPRVRVEVLTWTTIFSELMAGIGWLAYGMMKTRKRFSPYELALAHRQSIHEQRLVDATFKTIQQQLAYDLPQQHAEAVFTPHAENSQQAQFNCQDIPTDDPLMIGNYYGCKQCATPFRAKRIDQTHCPDCAPQPTEQQQQHEPEEEAFGVLDANGRKQVGSRYRCENDTCSNSYICRHVNQKVCPDCRHAREDKFRASEGIKC